MGNRKGVFASLDTDLPTLPFPYTAHSLILMTLLVLACFLCPSSRDQALVLVAQAQFHGGRGLVFDWGEARAPGRYE
jgi:hypothetical protein